LTQALAPNPKEMPSGQWTRPYPVRLGVSTVDQYMINSVIENLEKKNPHFWHAFAVPFTRSCLWLSLPSFN
jgi:hypothetical protein